MTLSVLTLVKDRPGHLAQLVEGLRRSLVPPEELVVVDMASEPPVSIGGTDFPVRIVRLGGPGLPLAAARNAAAGAARSENILFLDVDCIPMAGLVGAAAQILGNQDVLVCAPVHYLGPLDARGAWEEMDLLGRAQEHPVRQFPAQGLKQEDNAGLFWSLVFAIRRARFFDLGGFDERFTGYGAEDTDFGFRARDAGLPLLFSRDPGAFHQHHETFEPPMQHIEDIVRNALTFYTKWGQWPMEGWLSAFRSKGLIDWDETAISLRRMPTPDEIAQAGNRSGRG
ncbi:galactosyltransferase-related protein [Novosphingobium sp. PhB55]|uniref:glycosyltransferase family 2 protein n=1 Tax=Novosphingobium sp. PhB55 TaxID=2485106 RepID=UPI001AB0291B|nr:galactosyltransferase-related protein [Novosphingobium sp. PhB55]